MGMRYLVAILIVCFYLVQGCAQINHFTSSDAEQARQDSLQKHWQQQVEAGTLGKADFIAGEIKNVDEWPFPMNKLEVFYEQQLVGDPYEYGTCAYFIRNKNKAGPYRAITLFTIRKDGDLGEVIFEDDVGPCKNQLTKILQGVQFTPSFYDREPMPVLVVYPLDFDYKYGIDKDKKVITEEG